MADHPELLQAIVESPDDDDVRLVYADWLDENGEPERAEFIRLHCRLARMLDTNPDPFQPGGEVISANILRPEVRDRLLRPLFEVGLEHVTPGPDHVPWSGCHALFRRGFVEGLQVFRTVHIASLGLSAAELFRRTPLRHLQLVVNWEQPESPPRAPVARAIQTLVALPAIRGLQTLAISGYGLDEPTARALLRSPHLGPQLQLSFDAHALGDELRDALRDRFGDCLQIQEGIPF
jgi:uncharacterized protein (TIGR02996 family)